MKPRRLSPRGATALMTLSSICLTLTVSADSLYKEDNEDNLNLGSSWESGVVPGASDIASWDSLVTSGSDLNLGADLSWSGIAIANPAGPVTINGTNTLTLGADGVMLFDLAPPLTLNVPVILGADQAWNAASGTTLNITGVVSGSGVLSKAGTGNLVFSGTQSNVFTGPFVLDSTNAGIATSTFFGKTGGAVAVPANSVITFGNGASGQSNLRMMQSNQFGAGTVMSFVNPAGQWSRFDLMATNQTLAGLQAGVPATGINAGAVIQNREINGSANRGLSVLTLNGNLDDPNYPAGGYHFNGYIRDADSGDNAGNLLALVKDGTGTQALSGNQLGYEGGTTVNGGVLDFVTTNSMDNARGGWTINAGGMIRAVAAHNVYGGINLNGGELAGIGETLATWGQIVLHGNVTVGGDSTSTISADLRIGGNTDRVFNVGATGDPSGIDLDFATGATSIGRLGHLNNNSWGFMTKTGPGTLRFNNPGDIGRITHNEGKIIFNESFAGMGNGGLINRAAVEIINSGELIFGSAIHGNGSIVKTGEGLLALTSAGSSYTGTLEIAEGDLGFANGSGVLTFAGDISGPGSLIKSGAGTAVLTGNLNHTGGTFITGGILSVPGDFNEDLTVSSGGGFLGGDSVTSLALDAANYFSSGSPLAVTGDLGLAGDNWVYLAAPPVLGTGDILLMTYGGTLTGTADNLSFPQAANYRGTPVFTVGGGEVKLGGLVFKSLVWTGAEDGFWNLLTTPNWSDGSGAETFATGDAVTFDDSAPIKTVMLPEASLLSPSLVTFNNSSGNDYTIAGNGVNRGFTGGTSIVKNGSGTATIQGFSHNYTGTVTINGGVLQPNGNWELLGNSSGVTVNVGGQLNINGMNLGNGTRHYSLTIAGEGPDGQGALTNTAAGGPASNAGLLNLELSADATVGGNGGRFDIGRSGSIIGTIDGNGHTLTKVGTGNVTMRGIASDITYVVNGGSLKFEDSDSATGTNAIVVNGGILQGWGNRTFPNNLQFAAGTALDSDGGGTQTWTGSVALTSPGNLTLAARSGALILTGGISGDGSVTKTGGNVLRMLGEISNTFTGSFLLPTDANGTTFLGKTGGAVAIPAGATIEFGTTVLTGQVNLRMLQDQQFGDGVRINFNNPWNQWSRFDLMGTDQSLAGLSTGSPAVAGGGVVQNREQGNNSTVYGTSVLTLTGNENDPGYPVGGYYFNGHLRDSDNAGIQADNRLEVVKNGTATQTFTSSPGQVSRISFSGPLTVNAGRLIGAGARNNQAPGNWGGLGAGLNTRTITVNAGGIIDFAVANMWGNHNHTNVPTLVVNGGTVTNSDPAEPEGKINNALNNVVLNNGTLTSTTGNSISVIGDSRPGEGYGAWGINGGLVSTGTSTISTTSPAGYVLLGSAGIDTVFDVTDGTLTVSTPLQDGDSAIMANLVKNGAGTLVLSADNRYTANTIINEGSVVLTESGSLRFKVTDLSSTMITGTGSISLNGSLAIDTSAVVEESGTWTLLDTGTLAESYGASFTLGAGWSENAGVWTRIAGAQTWTFSQASGELSLASAEVGYGPWIGSYGLTGDDALATADPDNDGIPNGVEMVLGGNPADSMDAALLPTLELVADPDGMPAGEYLLFTYRRTDLSVAAGVTATSQYNTGLSDPWSNAVHGEAGVSVLVDEAFASFDPPATAPTARVRVYIPRTGNTPLFGRLSVMVP